jgi:hypothetical protein
VNDKPADVAVRGKVQWTDFNRKVVREWEVAQRSASSDPAEIVWEIPSSAFDASRAEGFFFALFAVVEMTTVEMFTIFFFPTRFKDSAMAREGQVHCRHRGFA